MAKAKTASATSGPGYVILSAQWANEEQTAAKLITQDHGEVLTSPGNDPYGWPEFQSWLAAGNTCAPYETEPEPDLGPIIVPVDVFFDRTTLEEADAIDAAMQTKPVKHRRAYNAASEFRQDTDLWPVLRGVIVDLYGEARADELLARPAMNAAMAADEDPAA